MTTQSASIATVSVIGGAIIEVIAGINFYLYNKTTTQFSDFHNRLDHTQRFLLANSLVSMMRDDEKKYETRAALVHIIAKP